MVGLSELHAAQPKVVDALRAALRRARLHHAYLLVGAAGAPLGPVTDALCQTLVCSDKSAPEADGCGTCFACRKLASGNHPDVTVVAPNDKQVISIDAVRAATARLGLRACEAQVKIVTMREAQCMAPAAQNALLKTLEEPVGDTLFILQAQGVRALLPTVRSRCLCLHLEPPDMASATTALRDAGVPEPLAAVLLPALGGDGARAGTIAELAAAVWTPLQEALRPQAGAGEIFRVAADLGGERERYELALALTEVWVRDRLAETHGARAAQIHQPALAPVAAEAPRRAGLLAAAAAELSRLRRLQTYNLNRAMALESVLLTLAGLRAHQA